MGTVGTWIPIPGGNRVLDASPGSWVPFRTGPRRPPRGPKLAPKPRPAAG